MSDPIAEAAANLDAAPSSSELLVEPANDGAQNDAAALQAKVNAAQANGETVTFATAPAVNAAVNAGFAALALNMLVNETPAVGALVIETKQYADGSSATGVAPLPDLSPAEQDAAEALPRESHLMLLEAKIAGFRAKLANAERVALDEFEAIVAHVKAVL